MSNIVKDEQGVYRWVYEFSLFRNPTILFTVLKVILGVAAVGLILLLVSTLPGLFNGSSNSASVAETLRFGGLLMLFFVGLTLVGYAVYAAMQGGTYCVLFTMDEQGITHKQLPKQYKKSQVVSALNVLAGLATGSPGQVGVGIITATRDSIASSFENVRSIKGSRALQVIKVNEPLAKNQVYVEPQDYDFVFDFIRSHCPNAQVKG